MQCDDDDDNSDGPNIHQSSIGDDQSDGPNTQSSIDRSVSAPSLTAIARQSRPVVRIERLDMNRYFLTFVICCSLALLCPSFFICRSVCLSVSHARKSVTATRT